MMLVKGMSAEEAGFVSGTGFGGTYCKKNPAYASRIV